MITDLLDEIAPIPALIRRYWNTRADQVKPGQSLVVRSERGKAVKELPIFAVRVNPSGCWNHVHITIKGGMVWCYDSQAMVETA